MFGIKHSPKDWVQHSQAPVRESSEEAGGPGLWTLSEMSWVGTHAAGASHTYGTLVSPRWGSKYGVQKVMAEAQAGAHNVRNAEARPWDESRWVVGAWEPTQQFHDVEDLHLHARLAWEAVCAPGDILVVDGDDWNVGEPLGGENNLVVRLRDIWVRDRLEAQHRMDQVRIDLGNEWKQALIDADVLHDVHQSMWGPGIERRGFNTHLEVYAGPGAPIVRQDKPI